MNTGMSRSLAKAATPRAVVAVLMGNYDRRDSFRIEPALSQPACRLAATESDVDQDVRVPVAHQSGIAGTSASE